MFCDEQRSSGVICFRATTLLAGLGDITENSGEGGQKRVGVTMLVGRTCQTEWWRTLSDTRQTT